MNKKPSTERHPGGRPGGYRLENHGGGQRGAGAATRGKERKGARQQARENGRPRADGKWVVVRVSAEEVAGMQGGKGVLVEELVMGLMLSKSRRQRGWTQEKLAKLAEVSRQEVGQLEAGRHTAGAGLWIRLCRALDAAFWRWERRAEAVARRLGKL